MKHYKSEEILSHFQNVTSPCANVKPLLKTFWRNLTAFRTTISLHSILSSLKKVTNAPIVNLAVATIWFALLDVFCLCVSNFTAVVSARITIVCYLQVSRLLPTGLALLGAPQSCVSNLFFTTYNIRT